MTKKKKNNTLGTQLSTELIGKIFVHLDVQNIKKVLQYRTSHLVLNNCPETWNSFCRTNGLTKKTCIEMLKENYALFQSIKNQTEKKTTFKTNQSDMTHILVYNGNIYVSSDDQSLRVFDFEGNLIKNYLGHMGGIWAFDFLNGRLVTGSTDKAARIWNTETETTLRILKYHRSTVRALRCYNNYIITGSRDHTIGIWNEMGDLVYKLEGHQQSVRCLEVFNQYLISGSYDGIVKLWDYKKGKYIRDICSHDRRVYCVKFYNGYVASAGLDSDLKVNKIDGGLGWSFKFSSSIVAWIDFQDQFLVASSVDGTIVKYNYIHKQIEFKIQESSTIKCQKVCRNLIIIGTAKQVKVFSFYSGKLIRILMDAYMISKIEMVDNKIIVGYITDGDYKISIFNFETH